MQILGGNYTHFAGSVASVAYRKLGLLQSFVSGVEHVASKCKEKKPTKQKFRLIYIMK